MPNISVSASSCTSNETDTFLANAHMMMEEMMNKTTMLTEIQHGATHSIQAVWTRNILSGLMGMLVVGRNHVTMFSRRRKTSSNKNFEDGDILV